VSTLITWDISLKLVCSYVSCAQQDMDGWIYSSAQFVQNISISNETYSVFHISEFNSSGVLSIMQTAIGSVSSTFYRVQQEWQVQYSKDINTMGSLICITI
jgi:hypothetical protein